MIEHEVNAWKVFGFDFIDAFLLCVFAVFAIVVSVYVVFVRIDIGRVFSILFIGSLFDLVVLDNLESLNGYDWVELSFWIDKFGW